MADSDSIPWKVSVAPPRASAGETSFYLRAWRRHPDGRLEEMRTSARTSDRARAEAQRAAHLADLNSGREGQPDASKLTVLGVVEARRAEPKNGRALNDHLRCLAVALAPTELATTPTGALTKGAIVRARDAFLRGGRKPATANLLVRVLAATWRWAEERELVAAPWPRVTKIKEDLTTKRPYSDTEVAALLDSLRTHDPVWFPVFSLLADSGCRLGEALGLRGRDVVRGDTPAVRFQKTKTGVPRTVPVPAATVDLLPKAAASRLVFDGLDRHAARDTLRRAIKRTGIADPENLDVHSFRRAWVATATAQGAPMFNAMRVTGHSQVDVFQGYQRNAVGLDLREITDSVHEARAGLASPSQNSPKSSREKTPRQAAFSGRTGRNQASQKADARIASDNPAMIVPHTQYGRSRCSAMA